MKARARMRKAVKRIELGCAGHFICAKDCRFRRHTQVGGAYRVSTVGDMYFDHEKGKRQTVGAGENSFFETYIFETTGVPDTGNEGCGCITVKEWSEIDGRRWATAGEAQAGHEEFVAKYMKLAALSKKRKGGG